MSGVVETETSFLRAADVTDAWVSTAPAAMPQAKPRGWIGRGVAMSVMAVVAVLAGGRATRDEDAFPVRAPIAVPGTDVVTEAPWPAEVLEALRRIAIQRDGRLQSFGQFANETLAFVTGGVQVGRQDPVQTLFSMMATPEVWRGLPLIQVPMSSVRDQLGMGGLARRISFSELAAQPVPPRIPLAAAPGQASDQQRASGREMRDVYARSALLGELFEQQLRVVPPLGGTGPGWLPLLEPNSYGNAQQVGIKRSWGTLLIALRGGRPDVMNTATKNLTGLLQNLHYPAPFRVAMGWKG